MSETVTRTCATTGLRLIAAAAGDIGYRIAKEKYPVISAPERTADVHRNEWSRYDTLGRTLYVAENRETAYAEVLSPFKRVLGAHDALAADAASLGMSVSDFVEAIAREWAERDFMGLGAIPAAWRYSRSIYEILLPQENWWVDIEHPDSIAALDTSFEQVLASEKITHLTTAVLRGENRRVTTMMATAVRAATLDDGSSPIGIHFGSKHGGAWCRAVWLDPESPELAALSGEPILLEDDDLKLTVDRFRIRVF